MIIYIYERMRGLALRNETELRFVFDFEIILIMDTNKNGLD